MINMNNFTEKQNELRLKWKQGEALTFLKEVCSSIPVEDIPSFTSYALKSAYDAKRIKSLDYLLCLDNRHEASLLYKIHIGVMLSNEKTNPKEIEIWKILCKHFPENDLLNYIEVFKKNIPQKRIEKIVLKEKEMIHLVYEQNINKNQNVKKALKI